MSDGQNKPGMDPQLQSILTSVLLMIATGVAGWAASHGIIGAGDQSNLANQIMLVASGLLMAGVTWWKSRNQSQKALIAAVNDDQTNGVKVVDKNAPVPMVTEPIQGVK